MKNNINKMIKELGLDKVKSIPIASLPDSMQQDIIESADYYREWYEEEVQKMYYECLTDKCLEKEARKMIIDIRSTLRRDFGLSRKKANRVTQKANTFEYIRKNPVELHLSPYDFTTRILEKLNKKTLLNTIHN